MTELLYPPAERRAHDVIDWWLNRAAEAMAWTGGATLIAMVIMSLISIISRKLGFQPVNGDVEMMQMGNAIAAAAFIPLCTLRGDHLRVEFFTEGFRPKVKRRFDAVGDSLLALVLAVLAWRTGFQALDGQDTGEVSPLLAVPLWIPVMLMVPSLALTGICAIYRTIVEFTVGLETPS
ncbi:TRAP dicarboxylate transporter DctQ subunit unknown substrate 3 [Paramagnetospirillum magnetotacticum MS-1]|uniref:TRAP transporter small permease protein n=1 Tax=Paramagnetospirillum magnetotacticum MS-1 TaxID=272627 RepID=A0A0C2V2C1_PARME|nr:TRAP transporter small permease [Paramagnetospirillum magnetotacticum]KIL99216.1 TRAP dicarboxylate transporter DctQ subunit unknown substrate 3 [Paramagnetospirillum magnetotacticum MS-1]